MTRRARSLLCLASYSNGCGRSYKSKVGPFSVRNEWHAGLWLFVLFARSSSLRSRFELADSCGTGFSPFDWAGRALDGLRTRPPALVFSQRRHGFALNCFKATPAKLDDLTDGY